MMTDNIKVLITPEGIKVKQLRRNRSTEANDLESQQNLNKKKQIKLQRKKTKHQATKAKKDLGLDDDEINALLESKCNFPNILH